MRCHRTPQAAQAKASPFQAFKVNNAPTWDIHFTGNGDNRERFLFIDYAKAVESSKTRGASPGLLFKSGSNYS